HSAGESGPRSSMDERSRPPRRSAFQGKAARQGRLSAEEYCDTLPSAHVESTGHGSGVRSRTYKSNCDLVSGSPASKQTRAAANAPGQKAALARIPLAPDAATAAAAAAPHAPAETPLRPRSTGRAFPSRTPDTHARCSRQLEAQPASHGWPNAARNVCRGGRARSALPAKQCAKARSIPLSETSFAPEH